MLPNIKMILYATDLSESARHAFGYAASLADRYGAKIVILHVIEDFSPAQRCSWPPCSAKTSGKRSGNDRKRK